MPISLTVGINDISLDKSDSKKTVRSFKGNSIIDSLTDYIVLDIETTGLDPNWDEIIELGAIKFENRTPVAQYNTLVKPENEIDTFITSLTGITNEMVVSAPSIESILPEFLDFIGDSIVIGHNVNFDINFIYDNSISHLNKPFTNNFIDTMRLSRKLFPDLKNHKLKTLITSFKISETVAHRALKDCQLTNSCYLHMLEHSVSQNIAIVDLFNTNRHADKLKASTITATNSDFDSTHPFFGNTVVFTGVLEKMLRKDAMQLVVDIGGFCADGVNKKTNYLVLGNNDYCSTIKDGKSSKHKKAEQYILEGQDLQIISENVFYDLVT